MVVPAINSRTSHVEEGLLAPLILIPPDDVRPAPGLDFETPLALRASLNNLLLDPRFGSPLLILPASPPDGISLTSANLSWVHKSLSAAELGLLYFVPIE